MDLGNAADINLDPIARMEMIEAQKKEEEELRIAIKIEAAKRVAAEQAKAATVPGKANATGPNGTSLKPADSSASGTSSNTTASGTSSNSTGSSSSPGSPSSSSPGSSSPTKKEKPPQSFVDFVKKLKPGVMDKLKKLGKAPKTPFVENDKATYEKDSKELKAIVNYFKYFFFSPSKQYSTYNRDPLYLHTLFTCFNIYNSINDAAKKQQEVTGGQKQTTTGAETPGTKETRTQNQTPINPYLLGVLYNMNIYNCVTPEFISNRMTYQKKAEKNKKDTKKIQDDITKTQKLIDKLDKDFKQERKEIQKKIYLKHKKLLEKEKDDTLYNKLIEKMGIELKKQLDPVVKRSNDNLAKHRKSLTTLQEKMDKISQKLVKPSEVKKESSDFRFVIQLRSSQEDLKKTESDMFSKMKDVDKTMFCTISNEIGKIKLKPYDIKNIVDFQKETCKVQKGGFNLIKVYLQDSVFMAKQMDYTTKGKEKNFKVAVSLIKCLIVSLHSEMLDIMKNNKLECASETSPDKKPPEKKD